MPLIETGAADGFGLGDEELALACASHRGEPSHVEKVAAWLAKIGLGEADLEQRSSLEQFLAPPLKTVAGREAGRFQPTSALQSF